MTVISLLVGHDRTDCYWPRSLYAYYVMMWSERLAAEVLSADCHRGGCATLAGLMGGSMLLWAVLAGAVDWLCCAVSWAGCC